jgi:hypothetical protein
MGVWGRSPQAGVAPLHPTFGFYLIHDPKGLARKSNPNFLYLLFSISCGVGILPALDDWVGKMPTPKNIARRVNPLSA